ncbi:antibiotic biosynthesis monooxygenase [Streptomyces sp. FXJ1.172]|uniref:putative quinol monooxygenase n=1 Tax=Streptomyces sp. FXJ1.172 TaxID=710705 RepID=UPI0007D013D6|nr:antibiotic biosynthesis monooxygenase [Streptomyces sp. FXJ1.172]WEP00466.1 antibiotic biosynthesis monooxygenase [Streptomyces sp. FXJ1.172]
MVDVGLFVRVEAKPGHEAAVEALLRAALPDVEAESGTIVWMALRLGPTTYAVVDAFPGEADRQAHLEAGRARLAEALEHFAQPPTLERTDVIAAKIPWPADRSAA